VHILQSQELKRAVQRSTWSVAFPPGLPPVRDFHLCSGPSQVLHNRPTPCQRSCRDCGSSPSPTGPLTASCRALVGPPGSRAWRFHACRGSLTSQVQRVLAIARPPVLPSHRINSVGILISRYFAAQCRVERKRTTCGTRQSDGSPGRARGARVFLPPPLKFRTVSFPQSGFKAG
jgi:hypothetical protein